MTKLRNGFIAVLLAAAVIFSSPVWGPTLEKLGPPKRVEYWITWQWYKPDHAAWTVKDTSDPKPATLNYYHKSAIPGNESQGHFMLASLPYQTGKTYTLEIFVNYGPPANFHVTCGIEFDGDAEDVQQLLQPGTKTCKVQT